MERPNHLHTAPESATSKLTGLVIVIAIHVLAIMGLIAALASDKILAQIQDIKATVEAQVEKPKPPPPPPPDFVPPPPPSAIIPSFTTTVEAPPPRPAPPPPAPPAPPRPAPPAPTQLVSIMRTHTEPAYPTISQRLGEQGTSTLDVTINVEGSVSECKVSKSSGSDRLDQAACDHVKARWRWQPPTREGQKVEATTRLNIVWNLKDAR